MLLRSAPVPGRLRSARDALDLIEAAIDDHTSTLVIVERVEGQGLLVNLTGPVPADHLERLHALVLRALDGEVGCRLVLVSRTSRDALTIGPTELARWRDLEARHASCEVVLLDWFLTDGDRAVSVATAAGDSPDWEGHAPGRQMR